MLLPLIHDDDCMRGVSCLLVDICNGVFTGQVKERLRARTLIPLSKDNGGVRPVGMGEVFYRLAVIYAMRAANSRTSNCFLPYSMALDFLVAVSESFISYAICCSTLLTVTSSVALTSGMPSTLVVVLTSGTRWSATTAA